MRALFSPMASILVAYKDFSEWFAVQFPTKNFLGTYLTVVLFLFFLLAHSAVISEHFVTKYCVVVVHPSMNLSTELFDAIQDRVVRDLIRALFSINCFFTI